MRFNKLFLGLTCIALFSPFMAKAQQPHQHKHEMTEELGQVKFLVSCSAAAQGQFNRAVALLHSFWYAEAAKGFSEVIGTDPRCGMGHWGVAMSNYHPVWAPPTPAELQKGLAAVERAKAVGAKTQREQDYIAAIGTFYKDADKLDHRTRALAYEKAMEQLYVRYPQDHEAAIFYALALLGTAQPTDKTYAKQKQAGEILNKVLVYEPEHPGVAHYLIHSFDYPQLAYLALPAARSYAKIAPSAPHALHMPSHIFMRLGLWQDSIQSNIASAAAAQKYVAKAAPGATAFDDMHAEDYLEYAYLQLGRDSEAGSVVEKVSRVDRLDVPNFAAAYALAA